MASPSSSGPLRLGLEIGGVYTYGPRSTRCVGTYRTTSAHQSPRRELCGEFKTLQVGLMDQRGGLLSNNPLRRSISIDKGTRLRRLFAN